MARAVHRSVLVALGIATALMASCAFAAKDVVVAVGSNFTTLDPYDANDTLSQAVAKSFYQGLFGLDKEMKLKNVLAESYTVSDDGLTYTVKLREGIKFQDGTDFNAAAVKAQFDEMKATVERFKDHPALLVWSIGNEAEASYTNLKLWDAINDIAKMIHETDPNHPTTTTLASSNVNHIKNIIEKAPHIDILSVNTYAPNLPGVLGNLQSAGWTKPYMITEFGPRGTWQMNPEPERVLPWGGLVEQTSSEKEADYLKAYQENIAVNKDNGCLGSFVFLWGYQTHGEVLTWYGLFDKKGYTFPAVDAMQYAWTGSYPKNRAPVIATRNDILMNGKKAEDAIIVSPNSSNEAKVTATDPDGDALTYDWMIMKEKTASSDGSLPDGITGLIDDNTKKEITFKAPSTVGNYRLIVFVRDVKNKKVASAVIPFSVQ